MATGCDPALKVECFILTFVTEESEIRRHLNPCDLFFFLFSFFFSENSTIHVQLSYHEPLILLEMT